MITALLHHQFRRGASFAAGWNEGIGRYRGSMSGVIPGSHFIPRDDPMQYAASEAAVAFMIAMERTREHGR